MHPDTEAIQRLLHGELGVAEAAAVRDHIGRCADCRRRWEQAQEDEAQVFGLLGRLDEVAPATDISAVVRRARRPGRPLGRLAATLVLSAGLATAAYAMPGSPLPRWLVQVRQWIAGPVPVVPPTPVPPPVQGSSGIAVAPGEHFTIEFTVPQDTGTVTVRLGDGPALVATALGPGAAFETGPSRLVIRNEGARIGYEVLLPRTAASVDLRVAGRWLLHKRGQRIEAPVEAAPDGSYPIPLSAVLAP